jgi:hypothetical protein
MNERIKQLARQATEYAHTKNDSLHQFNLDALYEKFAELIVQDCIDVLDGKIYRASDHEGDEIWVDLILKEHFGVEE